jgi:hypothetical protein
MPQLQLPIFPAGITEINNQIAGEAMNPVTNPNAQSMNGSTPW